MKKRIFLIEDEKELNLAAINLLLAPYEVVIAISVEAAFNVLDRHEKFDLIILDVMMSPGKYTYPETNGGIETGWRLYEDRLQQMTNIPIIVWTRNEKLFNKPWKDNVVKLTKKREPDHLLELVKAKLG